MYTIYTIYVNKHYYILLNLLRMNEPSHEEEAKSM